MIWQWIQNNLPIILIAVSFGISGIGWLFKKMQEAKEAKRVEDARKRARLEALRTGRIDVQSPAVPASRAGVRPAPHAQTPRQRLEDLARRRQQVQQPQERPPTQRTELEEQLRRRREAIDAQRQRQRQPSPARPAGQRPGPRPAQRPAAPPPQRTAVKPTPQPRRSGERLPISPLPTMQPVHETVIDDVISAKRAQEDRPMQAPIAVPGAGRRSVPILAGGLDLRKAVIMREILDQPVGLRDPRGPVW